MIAQAIYANEQILGHCLERNKGIKAKEGPGMIASMYRRLSGYIHTGVDNYKVNFSC